MKSYRPEKSDRSERSSKISGQCINRKKNLSVRPSDFFCLSYRGQVCEQRGSLPLSFRLLRRQNFGSSLAKFMIFGFARNDLANDPALTPANFSLPRQKYSTTKKWQQRLRRGESTRIFFLQRLHSHQYLTFMTGPRLKGVRFAYGRRLPYPRHVRRHPRRLRFANRRCLSYPWHARWHLAYPWHDQWQMSGISHHPKDD